MLTKYNNPGSNLSPQTFAHKIIKFYFWKDFDSAHPVPACALGQDRPAKSGFPGIPQNPTNFKLAVYF